MELKSLFKLPVIFIFSALILVFVLYSMETKPPAKSINKSKETTTDKNKTISTIDFEMLIQEAKKQLPQDAQVKLNLLETKLSSESNDASKEITLDTLASIWSSYNEQFISAQYCYQISELNPNENTWLVAARKYNQSLINNIKDSIQQMVVVSKTIECYEQVLKLNPINLDAKTELGVCYAEATNEPMKGIAMLLEIVNENPKHLNAHFNLGILSIKSGQYDKAIARFEKVLEINPDFKQAYWYLAETYKLLGDEQRSSIYIAKFKSFVNNNS